MFAGGDTAANGVIPLLLLSLSSNDYTSVTMLHCGHHMEALTAQKCSSNTQHLSERWENAQYHQNAPVSSISRHAFILQITYALDNAGQHDKIADTLNYADKDQEAQ